MEIKEYLKLKNQVCIAGYEHEITWAHNLESCKSADSFAFEAAWVIISAGLKNQVAERINEKFYMALAAGESALVSIGHKGKAQAIDHILTNRYELFKQFQEADNKIDFLQTLPWIGPIIKYHLAKNLGIDTCKPDRHLVRIAGAHDTDPFTLCKELSRKTGDKIAVVDMVLWRAANLGFV